MKHGLADTAQRQAGQCDPQLARTEACVEIIQEMSGHGRATLALGDQRIELGAAQLDQREFCRHEEAIDENEDHHSQQLEAYHDDLLEIHPSTCSPKMTLRISCTLTIPISTRSRETTTARRCPRRCIRCKAVSRRVSSERNRAGFGKSRAVRLRTSCS